MSIWPDTTGEMDPPRDGHWKDARWLVGDMDLLAQVVAELQDIYRSAVTEPETGNAWRDGYVTGYVRAMRTALTIASGTPPETPTTRVLAERADRRTT